MRKSTTQILGIIMGLSFLSLLYLQVGYIEKMVKMCKGQFNTSVRNALLRVSKDVEYDETQRWLLENIAEAERGALVQSSSTTEQKDGLIQQSEHYRFESPDGILYSGFELGMTATKPSKVSKTMISEKHGRNTIPRTSRGLIDAIENRYMYQRFLLDDVALRMVYKASDKSTGERVSFRRLDNYPRSNFINNGVELLYHFSVIGKNGREVYRYSDYGEGRSEDFYTQPLFQNDPPAKMSTVRVHFPRKKDYIFDSVSFTIPSMIFTFILLTTFIFTIYIVFRQRKLTEMENDFINNMTHKFRTPVSTISLIAQILKDPAVRKSPQMFQHISGVVDDETKRLRFQVEKVLQMSMLDRQKATLKVEELDASELITGVINTFALRVERYNGKITSDLEATNPVILADEIYITSVILNLMDNAVKYKKPEEDLVLDVRTWSELGELMISMQDNGIGIKKENLKKVFDRFYCVHTDNLHDIKGFGLGLAYVKKTIQDHKGTIRAESELNIGARFIIALPLLKND